MCVCGRGVPSERGQPRFGTEKTTTPAYQTPSSTGDRLAVVTPESQNQHSHPHSFCEEPQSPALTSAGVAAEAGPG